MDKIDEELKSLEGLGLSVPTEIKRRGKGRPRIDYPLYQERDWSILSDQEKEVLLLRMQISSEQMVAEKLGITLSRVKSILRTARQKLDGKYTPNNDYTPYLDKDLSVLSDKQKKVLLLRIQCGCNLMVAEKIGIKSKSVASILHAATLRLDGHVPSRIDYTIYLDKDWSDLSSREKEILSLRIKLGSNALVAEKMGIAAYSVASSLYAAKQKLDGNQDKLSKMQLKSNRKYLATHPEHRKKLNEQQNKKRKLNREEVNKKQREYNQTYYQNHRDEVLEKQKKIRDAKKALRLNAKQPPL